MSEGTLKTMHEIHWHSDRHRKYAKNLQLEQVSSFNILMSFGTFMHISYVALITHYNSNVHFIFNYNAYKDLVWTVNYYN